MLIKTDAFGAFWLLPIGFEFPKPNFRLSQELSGTKSTIKKVWPSACPLLGLCPLFGGTAQAWGALGLPWLVPWLLVALFSPGTHPVQGVKEELRLRIKWDRIVNYVEASSLLGSFSVVCLTDLFSLGWQWIGLSVCSTCGLGEAWGYVMNCA